MSERVDRKGNVEQRREIFIGKSAPETFTILVSLLPEIENVQFISYRPGLKWAGLYTSIAKLAIWDYVRTCFQSNYSFAITF